jgi:hypothetical protein
MAQKIVQLLVDDLTGEESDATDVENVEFSLDGYGFEIDLTDKNAAELRNIFAPYIAVARRRSRQLPSGRVTQRAPAQSNGHHRPVPVTRSRQHVPSQPSREQAATIRAWAKRQGYELSSRGRIPGNVLQAYQQHVDAL